MISIPAREFLGRRAGNDSRKNLLMRPCLAPAVTRTSSQPIPFCVLTLLHQT